ncbi:hypothetical protein ACFVMC_20545 [Nocardia sp. NPDC127579]|uniref:DUF6630 family protein n=1 Tax=Nocardia sp. NPDC127579 TaxID=3345402 RepID=UPI003645DAD5
MTGEYRDCGALTDIVEMLALDCPAALERLDRVFDTAPPQAALFHALARDRGDDYVGTLRFFDWKAADVEIQKGLSELPTYPQEFSWEWHDWTALGHRVYDSPLDPLYGFLSAIDANLGEHNMSLVGFWVDHEGYCLGFIPDDDLRELQYLARQVDVDLTFFY